MQTKPSWKIFLGPFPTPHRLPSQLPIHIQQLREMLQRKFSLLGEQCECHPELRTSEPCPPPNPVHATLPAAPHLGVLLLFCCRVCQCSCLQTAALLSPVPLAAHASRWAHFCSLQTLLLLQISV